MKLRDMMFLVIGGLLVISGMVLNSLLSGDAEAQEGVKNAEFGFITCKGLVVRNGSLTIVDNEYRKRGEFGLDTNDVATLRIYGDDGKTPVVGLGASPNENGEMMFYLRSKSKTDKREASMKIYEHGGRLDCNNKMGENVVRIVVGSDGGGLVDLRDKFGYVKKVLR